MIDLTIAVPVVLAVVSAAKMAGMPSKFAPLLSIGLGVVTFFFFGSGDAVSNIFEGVIVGLSASGLYSGAKASKSLVQ